MDFFREPNSGKKYVLTIYLENYLNQGLQMSILPHSAPSWILSLVENLARFNLQDGATEWHYSLTGTTHPPTAKLFL